MSIETGHNQVPSNTSHERLATDQEKLFYSLLGMLKAPGFISLIVGATLVGAQAGNPLGWGLAIGGAGAFMAGRFGESKTGIPEG